METLPAHVKPYKRTPVFTQDTLPNGLKKDHQTKPGTWGVIHVLEGTLAYTIGADEVHILTPDTPKGIVAPEQPHHVRALGDVTFFVEFNK